MNELKRACLTLLTLQAWLETYPPSEAREPLKSKLDDVLFWYRESLTKRWMRDAGVTQLHDWKSAWGARERNTPNAWLRDISFVDDVLPLLAVSLEKPLDYGLRRPSARDVMQMLIQDLRAYRELACTQATQAGLEVPAPQVMEVQDELQIYFERVAYAVR